MNSDEHCEICGGPCVYPEGHVETAGEDYSAGVSFMATWVEPETPADDTR